MNKIIKTKISYYRFNISNKEEKETYNKLMSELKKTDLKKDTHHFINFSYESNKEFMNKIKEMVKRGFVELDFKHIFNNQYNTTENSFNLRIWEFSENIFENLDIKEGYYLEMLPEIRDLQNNTLKCGYCGKYETNKNITFCTSCLSSEFLTLDYLKLLRLKPISDESDFKELTETEKKPLLIMYNKEQKKGRLKRLQENQIREVEKAKNKVKTLKTEYEGFLWLINHNIDFKNVIYYDHKDIFCFGWGEALSFEQEQNIKKILEHNEKDKFPFKYEIKTI